MIIKSMLSRCGKLTALDKTCFGNFLNFQLDVVFNFQLFHSAMSREIRVEAIDQYELWFGIDKYKVRFSKQKFCLVTSLKFRSLSNVFNEEYEAVDDGIHHRYFDKDNILVSLLHEKFKKVKFLKKKDESKMALVLFVEQILMR